MEFSGENSFLSFPFNDEDVGRESLGILDLSFFGRGSLSVEITHDLPTVIVTEPSRSKENLSPSFESTPQFAKIRELLKTSPSGGKFRSSPITLDKEEIGENVTAPCVDNCDREIQSNTCDNHTAPTLEKCDDDEEFNDCIFIEGNHLASKIADGSILRDGENFMLDSTQEPEELANAFSDEEEPIKHNTQTIHKIIDKKILPNTEEKSKEPLEIITNLKQILNDHHSDKQKSEGLNLLSSLENIFLSSACTKSLDNSGSSSVESDCPEVLDLRKKCSSYPNINKIESSQDYAYAPLDLSTKSKSTLQRTFASPKNLPPKYIQGKKSLMITSSCSLNSFNSISSNESNISDPMKKFRPRKTEAKPKKGPLKAVHPIDRVTRKSGGHTKVTPTRTEPPIHRLKKSTTPINETNVKPLAQSTPETVSSPIKKPGKLLGSSLVKQLNYSEESKMKKSCIAESKKEKSCGRSRSLSFSGPSGIPHKVYGSEKNSRRSAPFGKSESGKVSVLKENNVKKEKRLSAGSRIGKENVR